MAEEKLKRRRSTDDPLALMRKKSKIDARSYQASLVFKHDYSAAQRPRKRDPGEPVVRTPPKPGAPVGHLDASQRLVRLRQYLGEELYMMLVLVAGYGHTLTELEKRGCGEVRYLSQRLRDALAAASAFYESQPAPTTQLIEAGKAILSNASSASGRSA